MHCTGGAGRGTGSREPSPHVAGLSAVLGCGALGLRQALQGRWQHSSAKPAPQTPPLQRDMGTPAEVLFICFILSDEYQTNTSEYQWTIQHMQFGLPLPRPEAGPNQRHGQGRRVRERPKVHHPRGARLAEELPET